MTSHSLLPLLCVAALLAPRVVHGQQGPRPGDKIDVHEWTVPWANTRPRDPVADRNGQVWFVGQEGNYVARLDPRTGQFKRYEIDPGTNPHTINIAKDGTVWFTGNRNGMIGKLDPASGAITRFPMPDANAKDPHTIAFDAAGDLWFTLQNSNMVGHLVRSTGKIALVKMSVPGERPYGIVMDHKGRPWFDLFGTNKLGTIDPISLRVREYPLPDPRARPRRIAVTTDNAIWYVDYVRGFLGRLDPASGVVKEWPTPNGAKSLPYAMTVDDDDRLWFVETGVFPNQLVGFDPRDNRFFGMTSIGIAQANTVRHMTFDPVTRLIWFGSDQGTIGRVVVPPAKRTPVS